MIDGTKIIRALTWVLTEGRGRVLDVAGRDIAFHRHAETGGRMTVGSIRSGYRNLMVVGMRASRAICRTGPHTWMAPSRKMAARSASFSASSR